MAGDWEEVKRLAADFQRAQLGSTVQKLSERNCIEIVKKLIELKLISVIFTTDGKEYLTPERLLKEIRDELIFHGGRINLVELSQLIGVDYTHVEAKAVEFSKSKPDVKIVLGQLITSEYLDHLAEEVNEKLQQNGQISIAELTKEYDLPGDFLEAAVYNRLGTIIHGQADANDSRTFFTESYVAQHEARIRGGLSALTRALPITAFVSNTGCPERLFYSVADKLIKEGRIAGSVSGGRSERSVYIPDIYAKAQNEWIDAFYSQNGYLEYDSLSRLGISDPKGNISKRYKNESLSFLKSCCVGKAIFNQVEAAVEEALNTKSWVDIMPLLPSVFTLDDCQQLINLAVRSLSRQDSRYQILCESFVVSDAFLNRCIEAFDPLMNAKAQEDVLKKPQYFVTYKSLPPSMKSASKKDDDSTSKSKPDKKEERRKRAIGGKSGGGTQGRETKIKAVKKKYHTFKANEDSGSDDDSACTKDSRVTELEFLTVDDVRDNLLKMEICSDCPEALVSDLAEQLHRALSKRYQEVAMLIFTSTVASSGSSRRKLHSDLQEKMNTLLNHITLYEKSIKLFSDDVGPQLYRHILKTLCTDAVNMCVSYLASEHGISDSESETSLSPEARLKIIRKLPEKIQHPVMKLHSSLNAKSLEDFEATTDVVLGAGICDMIVRKADKKKERLLFSSHRESLMAQLSEAKDPALCLHLAILLVFQTQTHSMLHASGKFVPQIISYLQKQIPLDVYQTLSQYQEYVIQHLTAVDNNEDKEKVEKELYEMMPKIKDIAIMYKKVSVSET